MTQVLVTTGLTVAKLCTVTFVTDGQTTDGLHLRWARQKVGNPHKRWPPYIYCLPWQPVVLFYSSASPRSLESFDSTIANFQQQKTVYWLRAWDHCCSVLYVVCPVGNGRLQIESALSLHFLRLNRLYSKFLRNKERFSQDYSIKFNIFEIVFVCL